MRERRDLARIRFALARSSHFKALPPPALERLAQWARLQSLSHGERVAESGRHLWIVVDGAVRLSVRRPRAKRLCVHAVLGRGSYFGLAAAVGYEDFPLDAQVCGATHLACVDGNRLRAILRTYPALWRYVSTLLYGRLKVALGLLEDNRLRPLGERIVRCLLGHAASQELGPESGQPKVLLTQSDLARMTNASRSRTNQELQRLQCLGLLRVGYREIILADLAALRELAGDEVHAF
jgi:CRP-like cAMP-binding protein